MRIGLFTDTYYPEKNGVAVSTCQLKQSLEALGHVVYVFTVENKEASFDPRVIRLKTVSAVVVDGQRVAVPLFHHYLRMVEALRLDVIHTQTEFTVGILGLKAARRFGIPHVHTYHTVYEEYTDYIHLPGSPVSLKQLIRRLSAWWCNQTDLVIAPTKKTEDLLKSYQVTTGIQVIPTGLRLEKYAGPDLTHVAKLRAQYGLTPTDQVLIYLGRVSGEKRIDRLIRYVKRPMEEEAHLKLLIVGGGPEEEALHSLAAGLIPDGRVLFTGMVPWDEVQDYYALGDIFVSASTSETQGLTYYEAMAGGLPLLVHEDECLEAILAEEPAGGLSFTDEESFCAGLREILADRETFAGQARRTAEKFTADAFARRMAAGYQRLAEGWIGAADDRTDAQNVGGAAGDIRQENEAGERRQAPVYAIKGGRRSAG